MRRILTTSTLVGVLALFAIRCGKSTSSGNAVTDNVSAISEVPNSDPQSMDYSQTSVASSTLSTQSGFSSTFYVKLVHQPGTGLGTFKMYQCVGDTPAQIIYLSMGVVDDVYSGTMLFRRNDGQGHDDTTDISFSRKAGIAITDDAFSGSVDFKYNSQARLVVSADGATDTNTLKGTKSSTAIACKWNSDHGCAKVQGGSNIPFLVSVNGTTGAKTYSAGTDEAYCSDLTFTTVEANTTGFGSDTWDCSLPSGASWVTPTRGDGTTLTAPQIEDAGGADCASKSDSWESRSADPSACGAGNSATSIGCFCDALYSMAAQGVRRAHRMGMCKAKGLFKLVKAGTISNVTFSEGGTIYVKMSLGQ